MTNNRRFFKRSRQLQISVNLMRADGSSLLGYIVSIGPGGVGIVTDVPLEISEQLHFQVLDPTLINLREVQIQVLWRGSKQSPDYLYGGRFVQLTNEQKALLAVSMPKIYHRAQRANKKIIQMSLIVGLGILLPTIFVIGLFRRLGNDWGISFFALFAIIVFRFWETFLTSKEQQPFKDSDDWTISAVVLYFVVMLVGVGAEITFLPHRYFAWQAAAVGGLVYGLAFAFRLHCMRVLGKNWGIHVMDDGVNPAEQNIIREGPYRYVRHPIYFGVIAELLGIPLMFNAFISLAFVVIVNIPLQVLRSRIEEENLLKKHGGAYASYMMEVRGLFPKLSWQDKVVVSDRRRYIFDLETNDRRRV